MITRSVIGTFLTAGLFVASGLLPPPVAQAQAPPKEKEVAKHAVLQAMEKELARSYKELQGKGPHPFYYLSYIAWETDEVSIGAEYGAMTNMPTSKLPRRLLNVSARVGSYKLDNTHQIRGGGFGYSFGGWGGESLPVEDDVEALRTVIWSATDEAFKSAQERFSKVKTDKKVMVEEEDLSDDFSRETSHVAIRGLVKQGLDVEAWQDKIRAFSARFKAYPHMLDSGVSIRARAQNRWFVSSEGTTIQSGQAGYRIGITGQTKAEDGMNLFLVKTFFSPDVEHLPKDEEVEAEIDKLATTLAKLREAPLVEPFVGPAILCNKAAAVFFHEIFGHRIEGHRQRDVDEGQTFTKKVGKRIMPEFITIVEAPPAKKLGDPFLMGHYDFDDEGVPAQKVTVVENGILKNFLMNRTPVKGFPRSNGHGRCQPGSTPVARMANTLIQSSKRVPFAQLKKMLIEEVKKQGKPYGLMFHEIAGGFTMTGRYFPQTFKVMPLLVTRVYVDGRPDELVRGVDIVGTPIMSLEQMIATGDDEAAFHGFCGAESGSVPVSSICPSVLVASIEVEKTSKEQDRPPLLPPPAHDKEGGKKGRDDAGKE
ncbi:MAG: TldD/PmbA family protein [Planctomycetota bacterium]